MFGPFVLDTETGRLLEGARDIPLAPKPFETLVYLASRPGRVVPRTELMERLWPETFVTDDVLVQCVVEIRRALGDQAKTPRYIRTLPRRGYQFLAPAHPVEGTLPPGSATSPAGAAVGPAHVGPPDTPPGRPTARAAVRTWALRAGAVLLLAAGTWYALHRLGREGPLSPSVQAADPGSLVVMPIVVEEPTPQTGWLRHGLAEMIRSQLGQNPGVHVVARHRLATALAEEGYDEDKGPEPDAADRVARRLRAERLVTGSYVRVEDRFVLSAQLINLGTGQTESSASVRGTHPSGVLDAVNEVCLKLAQELRPGRGANEPENGRTARMPTVSIEAYRHYAEAVARFARGGRQAAEEAEELLDSASQLDPRFALAFLKKAEIQQWRREWGYGDPDPAPAVLKASRLLRELPERERLLVESFEALIVKDEPASALKAWSALLQFYPTYAQEIGIPPLAANVLMRQGRWDDLILMGEANVGSASLPESDKARLSSLLAQAFRRKGEFERALEYAHRAVRLWLTREGPLFLNQRILLGRISLEAGRRADALAEFRAAGRAPEADVVNLSDAAWGLYMSGEAAEAAALVARAIALDPAYGNAHHLEGWLALARRDYAAAARSFRVAFERTPRAFGSAHQGLVGVDLGAAYYAGVADQKAGQGQRAVSELRRLMEQCRGLLAHPGLDPGSGPHWQAASYLARAAARLGAVAPEPPRLQGDDTTFFVQSARLHAVQGKRDLALRELAQGLALGFGEYRHVQDDPDFESLRDSAEFKRLVTSRLPR